MCLFSLLCYISIPTSICSRERKSVFGLPTVISTGNFPIMKGQDLEPFKNIFQTNMASVLCFETICQRCSNIISAFGFVVLELPAEVLDHWFYKLPRVDVNDKIESNKINLRKVELICTETTSSMRSSCVVVTLKYRSNYG